jgi:hypothetical protein
MKSRLLLRAICVGAALLVPAGGLTVLGISTAGASTTVTTVSPSVAKLGTVGTLTLVGISCTGTGTFQCTGTHTGSFKKAGVKQGTAKITLTSWLITVSSGTVNKIKLKAQQVAIKSTTVPGINGCTILLPAITFTKSGTLFFAHTVSTSTVTAKGTCATKSTIQTEITGTKINATITV